MGSVICAISILSFIYYLRFIKTFGTDTPHTRKLSLRHIFRQCFCCHIASPISIPWAAKHSSANVCMGIYRKPILKRLFVRHRADPVLNKKLHWHIECIRQLIYRLGRTFFKFGFPAAYIMERCVPYSGLNSKPVSGHVPFFSRSSIIIFITLDITSARRNNIKGIML